MKLLILIGFAGFALGLMTTLIIISWDFDKWIRKNKKDFGGQRQRPEQSSLRRSVHLS